MDLNKIRREYLLGGLRRNNLKDSPIAQFELWLEQAIASELPDPTAMVLATVDAAHRPEQRIVLLKSVDEQGFVFFTNYSSAKAQQITGNGQVSILFPWHMMERQVRVCGTASKISKQESLQYFLTRPEESQLAAWASHQSQRLTSRQALLMQFKAMKDKFASGHIPLPDFWGGYRIVPERFEFWQGGANRLHDRFEYKLDSGQWAISRLAP